MQRELPRKEDLSRWHNVIGKGDVDSLSKKRQLARIGGKWSILQSQPISRLWSSGFRQCRHAYEMIATRRSQEITFLRVETYLGVVSLFS